MLKNRSCHFSDPSKYEKLRENARYSVISCEQVAQAWLIEFCRLRRKLPVNYGRLDELSKKYASTWDPISWAIAYESSPSSISLLSSTKLARASSIEKMKQVAPQTQGIKLTQLQKGPTSSSSATQSNMVGARRVDKHGLVPVRIRFCPRPGIRPHAVAVSGSFDDWQIRRPMIWDNALQAFSIAFALRPGHYTYKLIVDGDWTLNSDTLAEKDLNGNLNNILIVE